MFITNPPALVWINQPKPAKPTLYEECANVTKMADDSSRIHTVTETEESVLDMRTCPEPPSDKQLYDSLSYLLGDLGETERLSREGGERNEVFR